MRRRDFIAALGGAAAWPSAALPQAPGTPMIGFMSSRSREESTPHLEGFLRGLKDNGYIPGQTVAIEYRWANGRYERLPMLAAELVALHPAALAAPGGPPSALAAKAASREPRPGRELQSTWWQRHRRKPDHHRPRRQEGRIVAGAGARRDSDRVALEPEQSRFRTA